MEAQREEEIMRGRLDIEKAGTQLALERLGLSQELARQLMGYGLQRAGVEAGLTGNIGEILLATGLKGTEAEEIFGLGGLQEREKALDVYLNLLQQGFSTQLGLETAGIQTQAQTALQGAVDEATLRQAGLMAYLEATRTFPMMPRAPEIPPTGILPYILGGVGDITSGLTTGLAMGLMQGGGGGGKGGTTSTSSATTTTTGGGVETRTIRLMTKRD